MNPIGVTVKVDTSELDEALAKAKELEETLKRIEEIKKRCNKDTAF